MKRIIRPLVLFLVLAGVILCCLGVFLSLPATAPDVSSALAGPNVEHVDRGADAPAPLPDGSLPLTPSEEAQEADKLTVSVYLLTMLVLAIASFGASVLWRASYGCSRLTLVCWEQSASVASKKIVRGWPWPLRAPHSLGSSDSKGGPAPSLRSEGLTRSPD
jgi:hypothetical protein